MTNKLHVEIIGLGEPLVMLHGWGWHSGIWRPITQQLSQQFQLFLVDLPGCGKSPLLTDSYSIESISAQIQAVVPEKAAWLGWSLGGMIAWWVAINQPEKITRLITIASSPRFIAENAWPGVASQTAEKFKQSLVNDYKNTLYSFLDLQLRGSPKNTELFLQLEKQIPETANIQALLGGLDLLSTLDLRGDLHKVICPSIHIFGSLDTLVPNKITELLQQKLPHGQFATIRRAGHIPFLTHTPEFLNLICGE